MILKTSRRISPEAKFTVLAYDEPDGVVNKTVEEGETVSIFALTESVYVKWVTEEDQADVTDSNFDFISFYDRLEYRKVPKYVTGVSIASLGTDSEVILFRTK
jgi:hypothetical protein